MAHLTRAQSKSEKSSSQDEPDIDDIRDNLTDSYESADLHLGDESIEGEDNILHMAIIILKTPIRMEAKSRSRKKTNQMM